MTRSAAKVLLGFAVLAILPTAAAGAATKTVYMGLPPSSQRAFANLGADANAYFPSTVTIRRGDKVRFLPTGFHDADFPPRGHSGTPLLTAAGTVAGMSDGLGLPYWFNGKPNLQFTPSVLVNNYGRTATYDGSRGTLSGIPIGTNLKPFTVRFPKTGTFTYYCNLHSGMKGKVRVVGPGSRVSSAKADARTVKHDVARALADARGLQSFTLAVNTVQLGNSSPSGVEIYAMFPDKMTVPAGTVVTFQMSRYSHELHSAATGPGDPADPSSFLGKLASSISGGGPLDPAAVYPSDARPAAAPLTPNLHGNGFWNTGFMDTTPATPLPKSSQVRLVEAGTYVFYDLLHPFMKTVITVT